MGKQEEQEELQGKTTERPKRKKLRGYKKSKLIDYGVTKDQFFAVLEKVSSPIGKSESDSGKGQTSESHPSDDCNERHTR